MGILKTLTINGATYEVVSVVPATSVKLLANSWAGSGNSFSQVVQVPGVTPHTKVDLQPTSEQLEEFHYKILAFVAENNNGTITVYCIGDKPTGDHTIQITKTEVEGTGPIRGNTVGTTMPKPDWNQTDPAKADYILNKPYVPTFDDNTVGANVWTSQKVADEIMRQDRSPGIVCEASGDVIAVNDASDQQFAGLSIYGKTVQNGTPTPENPVPLESVGAGGSIGVVVRGKNLIYSIDKLTEKTVGGITFTPVYRADGLLDYINVNGTCTASNWSDYDLLTTAGNVRAVLPKGQTVTLHGTGSGVCLIIEGSGQNVNHTYNHNRTVKLESDQYWVFLRVWAGNIVQNAKIYPMLNLGDTALPYEPPKPRQALSASTPGGLHGMDSVKDEIDFARGVRVQRVYERTFNGNEDFVLDALNNFAIGIGGVYTPAMTYYMQTASTHFKGTIAAWSSMENNSAQAYGARLAIRCDDYATVDGFKAFLAEQYANGNPVRVQYALATPIETPLTAEELAQYAALHTGKPNTTVFNDSGAEMKLSYVADTKNYIDQKLAAISAAMLNA